MSTDDDLLDRLERARAALEQARDRVEEIGEDRLRDLREAHERTLSLFGKYQERATGSGDFKAFIEFQEEIAEFVSDLPANLPERDAFEAVSERMEKRRLSEQDFEAARDTLKPAAELAARLDERREAKNRLRSARRAVEDATFDLRQEIDRLEEVRSLGEADLDAPVGELREPIDAYNEAVQDAFEDFIETAPSREVLSVIRTARRYPLVDFDEVPAELFEYLQKNSIGTEPVSTLLEYTEFSRSKLAHYVDQPATFQRIIGGNRTYLDRLDAAALTVEWPPPPAEDLWWRAEELLAMLNRFAGEEAIAALRELREEAREKSRYARLRRAARAKAELTDSERERVESGRIEDELATARDRLTRLQEALEARSLARKSG